MTINRISKINQIAETARLIFKVNPFKSIYRVDSCRTGNPYQVTVEWGKDSQGNVTLTGSLFTFDAKEAVEGKQGKPDNHVANYGNSPVCYQILGVAKAMAKAQGKQLNFCNSQEDANYLALLGGQVVKIVKPGGKVQWAVAIKPKSNLAQRVNLLRGPVENGIN